MSALDTLTWVMVIAAVWGVAGLIYLRRTRGMDEGARPRLVVLPLFLMVRLPHGFKYFERFKGTRAAKAYMWFSIAAGILSLTGFYLLVAQGLYVKYISPPAEGGGAAAGFVPIIPFVTIKGPLLAYILFTIGVAALVHELSHAFAARTSGIPVKSGGFLLLAFIPAAFVEPDEESLRRASLRKRAYVYTAGPAANVIVALLAIAVLYAGLVTPVQGVCILGVDENMPAGKVGLQPGDIIVAVNGVPVTDANFSDVYDPIPAGENFTLTILRDGAEINVTIWKEETSEGALMGVKVQPGPLCDTLYMTLFTMYWINLSLAVINMAPIFITDGGRLVSDLLEEKLGASKNVSYMVQAAHLIVFLSLITIP